MHPLKGVNEHTRQDTPDTVANVSTAYENLSKGGSTEQAKPKVRFGSQYEVQN